MGCPPVREDNPRAKASKLVDYLHVQADNPWYNYFIPPTFSVDLAQHGLSVLKLVRVV